MFALLHEADRYQDQLDDAYGTGGMERFPRRPECAYPVRSHAARIRGIVRSRASLAARCKAHACGMQRRGAKGRTEWVRMA